MLAKKLKAEDLPEELLKQIPLEVNVTQQDTILPDPDLMRYWNNVKNRTLYLESDIDGETITSFSKMIIAWNREDERDQIPPEQRKPIKLMLYTYGGEIDATLHLVDIIELSKTPVYTYNLGIAMSGGLYLLICAHKRFALKNSQALFHLGSGGVTGTAEQVKSHAIQYDKVLNVLCDMVLKRTKVSDTLLKKKKKTEWFINGSEQVELGMVDQIITDIGDLL
jgi:ATP-dependent Clp protease, protease subunit